VDSLPGKVANKTVKYFILQSVSVNLQGNLAAPHFHRVGAPLAGNLQIRILQKVCPICYSCAV
jgi:hypothetical protein